MTARAASLGEAARRLLKCDGSRLVVPLEVVHDAQKLSLEVSDELPGLLREPKVEVGAEIGVVRIWSPNGLLASIGGREGDLAIVWVPVARGEIENVWNDFHKIVSDLLSAGYPGCIDCAGPAAVEPWDEAARRAEF